MSTLRGNLKSISLTDVIQLLHVNKKTGKILVSEGRHSGILYVQSGEVVHAETPQSVGEAAAFEILEWERGEFEFVATSLKSPASIRRSVQDLLMEAARTSDSRRRLRTIFPNMRAIPWPTVTGDALTQGLKMFSEDRRVMPYLDGYRTFSDIMNAAELNDVSVMQTCLMLKEAGRLTVLEPELSLSVTPMKTGLFKRGNHVELPKATEVFWRDLAPQGPYAQPGAIKRVRLSWPQGPAIEEVTFVSGIKDDQVAIPKELMQTWGLPEGIFITVRPAP